MSWRASRRVLFLSGSTMRILLCNDDGYRADGIRALRRALERFAEVEVIAPEHNNSAKSNALSVHTPIYVREAGPKERYVTGTPADCMHLALTTQLLDFKPDLVVSGINNGANMGDDTLYSGTVGAAMEGYLFGIPAIAFSQVNYGWAHLDAAADKAAEIVQTFAQEPGLWLLNVNIPNLPAQDIKPAQITRLGRRHAAQPAIVQVNPHGETMYWIGPAGQAQDASEGTDFHATAHGHVSISPLNIDLTHYASQADWRLRLAAMQARRPQAL